MKTKMRAPTTLKKMGARGMRAFKELAFTWGSTLTVKDGPGKKRNTESGWAGKLDKPSGGKTMMVGRTSTRKPGVKK